MVQTPQSPSSMSSTQNALGIGPISASAYHRSDPFSAEAIGHVPLRIQPRIATLPLHLWSLLRFDILTNLYTPGVYVYVHVRNAPPESRSASRSCRLHRLWSWKWNRRQSNGGKVSPWLRDPLCPRSAFLSMSSFFVYT